MKLTIEIEKDYYELIKFSVEHGDYYRLYTIIANGKPYEEIINEDIRDAIKQGYNDGYEMAKAKYERPQGEWIKIFENPFTNGYVCPFCNHKIQVTEQFLPQVTECESCGADMRGGAE